MTVANIRFGRAGKGGSTNAPAGTVFSPESGENLTTNASTSVASTATAPTDKNQFALVVRVSLNEPGYVAIGASPTATKDGDSTRVQSEEYFVCNPGDKVAVIDEA